jgi:hypothetical protein
MVVSGSADNNMRPIMKIASYLESNQIYNGVTIWGVFHHGGKCDLHIAYGNLEEKLLPFARPTFWHNFVNEDDNARPQFHGNRRDRTYGMASSVSGYESYREPVVRSNTHHGCKCQPAYSAPANPD